MAGPSLKLLLRAAVARRAATSSARAGATADAFEVARRASDLPSPRRNRSRHDRETVEVVTGESSGHSAGSWVLLLIGAYVVVNFFPAFLGVSLVLLFAPASQADADPTAVPGIPPIVALAYMTAADQVTSIVEGCVLRPAILAGIGAVESGHGTHGGATADDNGNVSPPIIGPPLNGSAGTQRILDTDDGELDGDTTYDRAVGPMQFIPSSWRIFGQDGNGDRAADPHNIFDAALAAAVHLCSPNPVDLNADEDALYDAIFAYNNSTEYVADVLARIQQYDLAFGASSRGPVDVDGLLANPNLSLSANARADLQAGVIDPRAVTMLAVIAQTTPIYVCCLKSGHAQCIGGGSRASRPNCSESHHWYGRGIDISTVGGEAVDNGNGAARAIVDMLAAWPVDDVFRPEEVGSPWAEYDALPGFFNDADHEDHLHLGWCGVRWSNGTYGTTCP